MKIDKAMSKLIERLRSEADISDRPGQPDRLHALADEFAAALKAAARENACVALVADIRFACGDNGKRSQPELVEYIRGLARDAERYRWIKKSAFCNVWARGDGIALVVPRTPTASIDSRIDAEMAKENKS